MVYATLTEIKTDRNISNDTDDAILTDKLNAATARIDEYTGRNFQAQTNETRDFSLYDIEHNVLWLDDDLCEINSITVEADNGSGGVTLATTDYITKPRNKTPYYAIKMISSSNNVWSYSQSPDTAIKVSGKWGWSQTPNALVKSVCLELAGYYYVRRQAQDYDVVGSADLGQITAPGSGENAILARLNSLVKR